MLVGALVVGVGVGADETVGKLVGAGAGTPVGAGDGTVETDGEGDGANVTVS